MIYLDKLPVVCICGNDLKAQRNIDSPTIIIEHGDTQQKCILEEESLWEMEAKLGWWMHYIHDEAADV